MKTRNLYYRVFFIFLLFALSTEAQTIATEKNTVATVISVGDSNLPPDPDLRTGVLPNGFTYYIRKNKEPLNRATFYLPMKAGSVLENENESGLAHFLEHMAFNGTKNFPKNELINYLQTNGVRFGADINAYTSFNETVFQLPLPTDNPEIIKNGLQILRDWAADILLESGEIDKERGVIIEEKRTGKGAAERMQKQYLPMLLNHSRFVDRLPIGTEEILLNFKPETIREFYKRWYRPGLQGLIVVGDINAEEMEKWIIEKFSDLKNPTDIEERPWYSVPFTGVNQFLVVTDKEQINTVIQVLIKKEASEFKTVADFKKSIYKQLFNNMISARITELGKQENPPFLQGGSNIGNFMLNVDVASIVAVVKPGALETGFKAVLVETERVQKFGFTQTELERTKQALLAYYESRYKEKDKTHSQVFVNKYLKMFLNAEAARGPEYDYHFYKEHLPKVTLEEVNALASEYFTDKNRDILILAPENQKDSLPSENTVLQWMKQVGASDPGPYDDGVSGKTLMSRIPILGKIIKEKEIKSLGLKELTLSNGVKVILKPTHFKNDEIQFSSFSPGGNSLYSDGDYQSAVNAPGVVASSGVSHFNSIELPKVIAGKIVSLSPYISERYEGINGSTSPADLETALQLVHLFFTEPRIDSGIVKGLVSNFKSSLTNRGNDPNSVFSDSANAILGNYHPRRTGPTIEKANQISSTRAFEIYKDRFADASDFTFFFVGNINEDSIKPLLETYLGSLPSIKRKEEARDLGIRIPPGQIKKVIYKGKEDKAFVQLVYSGDYKYGLKQNLFMNGLEEILKIRLTERLRETEEGVYSPSASVNYSPVPKPRFNVSIGFSCAPENVDKLIAATVDEIQQLQTSGPEEKDVIKFISEQERTRQTQLKTNKYWLSYLSGQYKIDGNMEEVYKYDKVLKSVSAKDIQRAAKAYLSPQNFIQLILLPETSK